MGREIKSITIGLAVDEVQEVARWYQTLLGEVEMIEPAPGAIELKLCNNVWLQLDDIGLGISLGISLGVIVGAVYASRKSSEIRDDEK